MFKNKPVMVVFLICVVIAGFVQGAIHPGNTRVYLQAIPFDRTTQKRGDIAQLRLTDYLRRVADAKAHGVNPASVPKPEYTP